MPTIQVQCVEHDLMIVNLPLLASGSVGVDAVQFSFCPTWDGFSKTAIFYSNTGMSKSVLLDDFGKCLVPSEILRSGEPFEFGAVGIKDGLTLSTERLKYSPKVGSYSSRSISEPSPSIYQQIVEKLVEIEMDLSDVVTATEELESYLSTV